MLDGAIQFWWQAADCGLSLCPIQLAQLMQTPVTSGY